MNLNEAKNPREREMLIEAHAKLWTADIVSNGMINEIAPLIAALGRGAAAVGQTAARVGAAAVRAGGQAAKAIGQAAQKGVKQATKAVSKTAKGSKGKAKDLGSNLKDRAKKKLRDKVEEKGMEMLQGEEKEQKQQAQQQSQGEAGAESGDPSTAMSWMSDAEANMEQTMNGFKDLNGAADSLQTNVEQCFGSVQNDDVKGIMTKGAEQAVSNLQAAYETQLNTIIKDITTSADKAGLGMDEAQVKSAAIVSMAAAIAKLTKQVANAK